MLTMHRSAMMARPRSICYICDAISTQPRRTSQPLLASRQISNAYQVRQTLRPFTSTQARSLPSSSFESNLERPNAPPTAKPPSLSQSSVSDITNYLKTSELKVFAQRGIPSEANVKAALEVCHMLANWLTDDSVQPQITHLINELDSTASTLLSLDTSNTATSPPTPKPTEGMEYSAKLAHLKNRISETAYLILAHPPVKITPALLEQYITIQSKLVKPETLPKAFQLYASKPIPKEGSKPLTYTTPNPNRPEAAPESAVIDQALSTAIEARNLDAAVAIIDNTYATKAFIRSKLLRVGLLPATFIGLAPLAAYGIARNFSGLQETMDNKSATAMMFAGILAYIGFTASLGAITISTVNDQMKRVSWAPGIPLRKRWTREEERAAFDKVACAWGFQEEWRQGLESGEEWEALKEYLGHKGMILDRTELMEGMD
ncbi:hypothetical protein GGR57DRAFT_174041 [Xylariaceae sp. FL1272]|nr:hypothetical protein GGR57DRAFT_174041 [Xylariaceae sp. FL1272]